ncbi:TPA: hypothetical protein DEP21_01170 [Patescibacteria group bacterium]|nr:hypothetical protein [Candidatus Gracilibacteria bacterium]
MDNIENLEEGGIDAYEELLKEISAAENSATHCKANKEKAKKDYIKILDLAEPKLQEHYEVKLWNELDIYNDNKIALIIQKARDL